MTGNSTQDKLRALVLATLMIGSVFAGTVAFAGTAAANASTLSTSAANTPADGTVTVTGTLGAANEDVTFKFEDSNGDTDTVTKTEGSDDDQDSNANDFEFDIDLTELNLGTQVDVGTLTIYAQEASSFSTSEDSTTINVNPALSVSPDKVTVGEITVVSVDVTGTTESYDYTVDNPSNTEVASGSTSSSSFSFNVEPSTVGTYTVTVTAAGGETQTATFTSTNTIENLTLDPASPVDGDSVNINGDLVDGDGGVDGATVTLTDAGDDSVSSSTTVSDGSFSIDATLNDAGEYKLKNNGVKIENFTSSSAQANVTLQTAGNNTGGFEETYTVIVQDGDGNAINFNNYDGYVNITGEFSNVGSDTAATTVNTDLVDTGDDSNVDAIRVDPSATSAELDENEFQIKLTPVSGSEDVSVTLENNDNSISSTDGTATFYDGLEDSSDHENTPDTPDFVGSDSVAVTAADNLNVNVKQPGDGDIAAANGENVEIEVLGQDGNGPDSDATDNNDLKNATVSLSGPDVDLSTGEWYDDGSSNNLGEADSGDSTSVTFNSVTAAQAGTVTVEVSAYDDNGDQYTTTKDITVTGDKVQSVTPTEVSIEDNENISVEVTNADGTAVNNREVIIKDNSGNAEITVWDGDTTHTVQQLVIDGANGHINTAEDGSGTSIDSSISVNNGVYEAPNVTFATPGDLDVVVDKDASGSSNVQADLKKEISISGVNAFNVTADKEPLVTGVQETVHFTVTNQTGANVSESTLNEFLSETFTVKQKDSDVTATSPSAVDTNGDSTADAIKVDVLPTETDRKVNVTVGTAGDAKTGDGSIDVATPVVETNVTNNRLTERLVQDVEATILHPRTDERLENAELQIEALNGTVEAKGHDGFTAAEDDIVDNADGPDSTSTVITSDNDLTDSNATFEVQAYNAKNNGFAVVLSAQVDDGFVPATTLNVEPMQVSAEPNNMTLGTQQTVDIEALDANGFAVENQRVDVVGAGVSITNANTDGTGFTSVQVNPQATGTINVYVDSDTEFYTGDETPASAANEDSGAVEATVNVTTEQKEFDVAVSPETVTANTDETVTVTVNNNATGDAVQNAAVELSGPGVSTSAVTDSQGQAAAQINASSNGTISVNVTKAGYAKATSSITVTEPSDTTQPPAIGDFENAPTDTDGDGLYDDVNGDETFDVNDVTALWANRDGSNVTDNADAFDFNGDGSFDVNDVTKLWNLYNQG